MGILLGTMPGARSEFAQRERVNCIVEGSAPFIPHRLAPADSCPPVQARHPVRYAPGCPRRPHVPLSGGGGCPRREKKAIVKVASPSPETAREDEGDTVQFDIPRRIPRLRRRRSR